MRGFPDPAPKPTAGLPSLSPVGVLAVFNNPNNVRVPQFLQRLELAAIRLRLNFRQVLVLVKPLNRNEFVVVEPSRLVYRGHAAGLMFLAQHVPVVEDFCHWGLALVPRCVIAKELLCLNA